MPIEQLPGVHGGVVYHDGRGYIFRRQRELRGIVYMVCACSICPARGNMYVDGDAIEVTKPHNHDPDLDLPKALMWRHRIIERCKMESGSPRQIYREEIAKAGPLGKHEILCSMFSSLQRARSSMAPNPPTPEDLRQFQKIVKEPEFSRFARTLNGDPWLVDVVSSGHGDLTAIFLPPSARRLLRQCEVFHVKNVCKIVPEDPPCDQLTTITAMVGDNGFLVALALMSKCSRMAYVAMLRRIVEEEPRWIPDVITADVEDILMSALEEVFGTTGLSLILGCWFYYTQDLWRRLPAFPDESISHQAARMALALPILPASFVSAGLSEIVTYVIETLEEEQLEQMLEFLQYVAENWVEKYGGQRLSVNELEHKLNYDIENLHCLIEACIGNTKKSSRPTFWEFLTGLQKLESNQHKILKDLLEKDKISKSRKKRHYQTLNREIQEFCTKFSSGAISLREFLALLSKKVYRCVWDGTDENGAKQQMAEEEGEIVEEEEGEIVEEEEGEIVEAEEGEIVEEEGEIVKEFDESMEDCSQHTIEEILLVDDNESETAKPKDAEEALAEADELHVISINSNGDDSETVIAECAERFCEVVEVPEITPFISDNEFEITKAAYSEIVPVTEGPEIVIVDTDGESENNEACYYVVMTDDV